MKEIELYDIITLDNEEEYTVLKILNDNNKKYYLLAPVDEEEEPDMENIDIVEEQKEGSRLVIEEIEDEQLLKRLSQLFLDSLRGTL